MKILIQNFKMKLILLILMSQLLFGEDLAQSLPTSDDNLDDKFFFETRGHVTEDIIPFQFFFETRGNVTEDILPFRCPPLLYKGKYF